MRNVHKNPGISTCHQLHFSVHIFVCWKHWLCSIYSVFCCTVTYKSFNNRTWNPLFGSKNSFVYLFFLPLVRIVRACPFNESFFHLDSYCTVLHIESVQLENAKTVLREGQSWQLSGRRKGTNLARMPPPPLPLTRTMGGGAGTVSHFTEQREWSHGGILFSSTWRWRGC